MSNITNFIKYELYPSLFESINIALPEHQFKRFSGGWRSQTYLSGSPHNSRIDKTVVTQKAPGLILEQGGATMSLVDYIKDRDKVDFITAVKTLANVVGLQLPNSSDFDRESYEKYKEQTTLLESLNSYFVYLLTESQNGGKDRDKVLNYLISTRGYSIENIKAMELGYTPSQERINKYLLGKGYSQILINEALQLSKDTRIGSTHKLSIPYRSGGSVKGFKFRTVGDESPKYLNNTGLDKKGGFFNLLSISGDKDIVIVEGELDSLHATVKGVANVVATGGSSISSEQIKDSVKRGARSFTICLDTEPGKEDKTNKSIDSIINIMLNEGVSKIYIATLPDLGEGKTDPDRLIKEKGVESFKLIIKGALPYYEYRLGKIIEKYGKIEEERGLQPKDIDSLLDEVVEGAANIQSPINRDLYKKLFTNIEQIRELGITEESLQITLDRLTSTKDKEAQATALNKLLLEAQALQNKGETDKALGILDNKLREVKLSNKTTEYSNLLLPITEAGVKERLTNKPDSLSSGYTIGGEELLLPSGAISIITAPTSHGKTTFLINLALNVVNKYPNKQTYLFSYEEDVDSILINTLNTYINEDMSINNRKSINTYFAKGSDEYFKANYKQTFKTKKDEFFNGLIETGRLNLNYTSYDSDTLIEAIRYLHKHSNIGSVFIDYMQLLHKGEQGKNKYNNRQEELKQICLDLKDLAVETGLPIILGAQFNRQVITPLDIHSTKIGEAGDIERVANVIVGLFNNNFKAPSLTDQQKREIDELGCLPDTIFATILKNRGGKVGLNEILEYNGNRGKITNKNNNDFFK